MATVQNANFIQYGRRAGKTRIGSASKKSDNEAGVEQAMMIKPMMAADGTDLRQIKVIPRHEWERIKNSLDATERALAELRQAKLEKETLHAESKEIVGKWSNTIAGQRQKKLEARKLREEREEEERVKVDIEEAQFQAAKRKEAIRKAKTLQYFQTDRIKTFHGALLLTEVMKEREAQIELKKQREASGWGKNQELQRKCREEYERAIVQDQKKAKARCKERKKISDYQRMQAQHCQEEREKEKDENMREGEELRKLAKLNEWEQKKLDEVKRNEKKNVMRAHKDHVANKAAIRALEEQQDEEEDEEIRMFAAAKKRMLKLRKEKEAELFKEVLDHKDKMTSRLAAQLQQKVHDEDDRIDRAFKQKEAKLEREMKEKAEKLKADLASIEAHRRNEMSKKEKHERERKQKALEYLEMKLEADRLFAEKQALRSENEREKKQKLQDFRMAQVNERAEKERAERDEDLHHDRMLGTVLAIEEEQFQQYYNKVLSDIKEGGGNPYPLHIAALGGVGGGRGPPFEGKGGIKPSYLTADSSGVQLPNNQRSSTDNMRSKCNAGEASVAKKRLGFVW